jgi:hypothetical protein
VDVDLVAIRVDVEAGENVELELGNPVFEDLAALWAGQLVLVVGGDLDSDGLFAGEGARTDGHGCVDLGALHLRLRCHGSCCGGCCCVCGKMLYIADGVFACVCCGKKVGGRTAAGSGFIC